MFDKQKKKLNKVFIKIKKCFKAFEDKCVPDSNFFFELIYFFPATKKI